MLILTEDVGRKNVCEVEVVVWIEFGTGPGHDQARNQVGVPAVVQDGPKRDKGELDGRECDQTMARGKTELAELTTGLE